MMELKSVPVDPPGGRDRPRAVAMVRLAIGLVQGAALFALYRLSEMERWPATAPLLFVPMLMAGLFLPLILTASQGVLSLSGQVTWLSASAVLLVAVSQYRIWSLGLPANADSYLRPALFLVLVLLPLVFVSLSLVLAAGREKRRIASYHGYFAISWKLAVQSLFAVFFVGSMWLVLHLGGVLFRLLNLPWLLDTLRSAWFAIPVSTMALSLAWHLTDTRFGIVSGIRQLALLLLSWLLPVAVLLIGGFLLAIAFTGLAPLWETRHGAVIVLGAAGALVVLINVVYQDGCYLAGLPRPLLWAMRIASTMLMPLTTIAMYALALRVADYGWTPGRVIAAQLCALMLVYAAGYLWSLPEASRLGRVNLFAAGVFLTLSLAALTPFADPVRLSVVNQVERLAARKVPADRFDFAFLRSDGGRFGLEALRRLASQREGPESETIRRGAKRALEFAPATNDGPAEATMPDLRANLRMLNDGMALPPGLLRENWRDRRHFPWLLPACLTRAGQTCDAVFVTLPARPLAQIALFAQARPPVLLAEKPDGGWTVAGTLPVPPTCLAWLKQALLSGRFTRLDPSFKDFFIDGQRLPLDRPLPELSFSCMVRPVKP
ncbi:DUF4153 domain-containing protein [Paludibacterium paludis]|uniref:DUF4153 domain-containing protein n=1 Tax=Paludibacterium paludis TaxID=1225769 RepID=A0A918NXH2_9NEIS|nr:DUF4153 domain-containing protein [Paludibacterium paludis]GGY03036.1 DUF4153 domain-containing protein [Paludibacterium paludis]